MKEPKPKSAWKAAKDANQKIYFGGKPCSNESHTKGRYVTSGLCVNCTFEKVAEDRRIEKESTPKVSRKGRKYNKKPITTNNNGLDKNSYGLFVLTKRNL